VDQELGGRHIRCDPPVADDEQYIVFNFRDGRRESKQHLSAFDFCGMTSSESIMLSSVGVIRRPLLGVVTSGSLEDMEMAESFICRPDVRAVLLH